ncbi:MAG: Fic family protein [Candidatus Pacearchaeota archaeon]|nr:Fic family protein [Candidatus Pacearchaeota archaeon]
MVTKYDIFELVYKNRAPIKPIDVVKKLNKDEREYHLIHRYLRELANEKLLIKKKQGFQTETTKKSELLYSLIYYCLKNGINYNFLLDRNFAQFVYKGLQEDEINSKNIKLNPRTLKKYVEILYKYGMILIISEKPLRAKIFYNILLNNLLVYFEYKHYFTTKKIKDYIPEISKELEIYRKLRKKDEVKYQKIINEFEIQFIYHSLSLEGNPITLPDTIKILKDKLISANLKSIDVDEIKNYQEAMSQMIMDANERKPLSLQIVLGYHKLAMRHHPHLAGNIRTINVFIKGNPNFKITPPREIKAELEKLFDKYNEFIKRKKVSLKETLQFASYFHNEFQHIHPFEDGNSRTTRLITFHLLQSQGIPILDIPFGLLDEYMDSTKASKSREDKALLNNLQKIILFNLKKINDKLTS